MELTKEDIEELREGKVWNVEDGTIVWARLAKWGNHPYTGIFLRFSDDRNHFIWINGAELSRGNIDCHCLPLESLVKIGSKVIKL